MSLGGLLEDVTVVDLTTVGPGARSAAMLADLGADVIKVGPPPSANRIVPKDWAYSAGRGTRRIGIDLKHPDGVNALLRLVASADVVLEGMRPGVADQLGIGFEATSAANPRIVHASLTGYGQEGPYAQRAGHDLNYQAIAGALWAGGRDADGAPALPGATFADSAGGGMHAALAICAALLRVRAAGKEGQAVHLDVAATEGVISFTSLLLDEHLATGIEPGPGHDVLTGRYACYGIYRCADGGFVSVGAIEAKFFANLCTLLEVPHLAEAQYDDDRHDEVRAALADAFAAKSRDEWTELLADKDTCVAPVLTVAEAANDEHLLARGGRARVTTSTGETFEQVGPVLAGSVRTDAVDAVTPADSNARELLSAAGLTDADIDRLIEAEVIA